MKPDPVIDRLESEVRRIGARVSQLEDAIEIYGAPPKRRRLPIPEITPAQREFLVWMTVFAVLSLVTATRRSHGE